MYKHPKTPAPTIRIEGGGRFAVEKDIIFVIIYRIVHMRFVSHLILTIFMACGSSFQ